jgi:hypothetical protein
MIFYFLLKCIRHDDIVHKNDAAGYIICISPFFFINIRTPCSHFSSYKLIYLLQFYRCGPMLTDAPKQGQPIQTRGRVRTCCTSTM